MEQAGQFYIGKYRVVEELGRGGMAVVYKAWDGELQRWVAIKVLAPQLAVDESAIERFRREAVAAANLKHPNIITIHDIGSQGDLHYIVMEYLDGITLDELLAQGPLSLERIAHILDQVAGALDYAHKQGVIHRDVKPSNIMVSRDDKVTLMDFGLVRAGEDSRLTQTGVVLGTPEYMSPEQAKGEEIDWRTDIYSLGVVLYKMLIGRPPFVRTTPHAVLLAHITEEPKLPPELRGKIPRTVWEVVLKATAKDRRARYQSAGEMARAFKAALDKKVTPGLVSIPWPAIAGVAAGVLAVVIAGLLAFFFLGGGKPAPTPTPPYIAMPPATFTVNTPTFTLPLPSASPSPKTVMLASTFTPSPAATFTRLPPSSTPTFTRVPPTPTSTPVIVVRTPAPTPVSGGAPLLLSPEDGHSTGGKVLFRWQWGEELGPNQGFEVLLWHKDKDAPYCCGAMDARETTRLMRRSGSTYEIEIDISGAYAARQHGGGEYQWSVVLVQLEPYARIGQPASPRRIVYVVTGPPGVPSQPTNTPVRWPARLARRALRTNTGIALPLIPTRTISSWSMQALLPAAVPIHTRCQ